MNRDTIISLMEDGAYFDALNCQFFHPSFRKGYRKMSDSAISWKAVQRMHGMFGTQRLTHTEKFIYRLTPA